MNYDNGRMREYLGYVFWEVEPGLRLLVGLDYWFKSDFEIIPLNERTLPDARRIWWDTNSRLYKLGELARQWHGLFDNENDRNKARKPDYFIKFALSKGFRPEWLDWAIEQNLYSQAQKNLTPGQQQKADFQQACLAVWKKNPALRIRGDEGIVNHPGIVKWQKICKPERLAIWASEVAPVGVQGRRGAPRKNIVHTKK